MANLPDLFALQDRVALVTGGAGLLGRQFCRTLADAGANVVVADIDGDAAQNVAGKIEGLAVEMDVASPHSVQAAVVKTIESFGRLDILVNSAALDPKFDSGQMEKHASSFEDYPLDLWNEALKVDLTGMFLCSQIAAKIMVAQKAGVIINICSIYGLVGPDQRIYRRKGKPPQYKPVAYSVTKAGTLGLTKYLAVYYAGKNIRVNALTPGGVFNDHDGEFVKAYAARAVLGRMAEPDEMNGALLFLASDASSYMTGANLVVDGGWTAW